MEMESLPYEMAKLKTGKTTLAANCQQFGHFESMTHSRLLLPFLTELKSLRNTLQKTLDFSIELTGAEQGSLVLLDVNGVVTDSISATGDCISDQGFGLIGRGLNQGLAGWVS